MKNGTNQPKEADSMIGGLDFVGRLLLLSFLAYLHLSRALKTLDKQGNLIRFLLIPFYSWRRQLHSYLKKSTRKDTSHSSVA
jgi:hypothetical protein